MLNASVFFTRTFKIINVQYPYYTRTVIYSFTYFFAKFLKRTFIKRYQIVPVPAVRMFTVIYAYRILLTMAGIFYRWNISLLEFFIAKMFLYCSGLFYLYRRVCCRKCFGPSHNPFQA